MRVGILDEVDLHRKTGDDALGRLPGFRCASWRSSFFFFFNLQSKAAELQFVSTEPPVELEQCLGCGRTAGEGGGLVNPVTN